MVEAGGGGRWKTGDHVSPQADNVGFAGIRSRWPERIAHCECIEDLPVVQVLGIQHVAPRLLCGCDDERVPEGHLPQDVAINGAVDIVDINRHDLHVTEGMNNVLCLERFDSQFAR